MKPLLFLFLSTSLASCCLVSSVDCNCEPPAPDLTPELIDWMKPYQETTMVALTDPSGEIDTLSIAFVADTEFCGGDECGSECERRTAQLSFGNPPATLFVMAYENNNLQIRSDSPLLDYHAGSGSLWTSAGYEGEYSDDFSFGSDTLEALQLFCTECGGQPVRGLTISRTLGPMEWIDADGILWKKL